MKIAHLRLIFTLLAAFFLLRAEAQQQLIVINGYAQGTTYQIKYEDGANRNFRQSIDSLLKKFDSALSLYDENSELSLFNRSHAVRFVSPYFLPVLIKSREIFESTGGLFDPTILPLAKAYGFGPNGKRGEKVSFNLDSVRQFVGFDKISFDSIAVRKSDDHVKLDFNAIAQGYSVDMVSDFLRSKNISNFLVEIGGELKGEGKKPDGTPWIVGVSNPLKPNELMGTVKIKDRGMATSGNYRNHYVRDGVTYTHIINPLTGLPGTSDILSITVFAPDAMTADGYATAFLLMGAERLKEQIHTFANLDVFMAYSSEKGNLETFCSEGLKSFLTLK